MVRGIASPVKNGATVNPFGTARRAPAGRETVLGMFVAGGVVSGGTKSGIVTR
jgi:hypothetical protein